MTIISRTKHLQNKLFLYLNTLKYLKLSQLFFLMYYRVFGFSKKVTRRSVPIKKIDIFFPEYKEPVFIDKNTIFLLNREKNIFGKIDWMPKKETKLWNYNLHYFDDLTAIRSSERRTLQQHFIDDWVENKDTNDYRWDPYPTSLRVVNFLKWSTKEKNIPDYFNHLIYEHAEHIRNNLEFHLGGNHLLTNAKALIFCGLFLDEPSNKFLKRGIEILDKQLDEQFFADGGHYERSPMYQNIMVYDLMDIYNLFDKTNPTCPIKKRLQKTILSALQWSKIMTHQDGSLVYFNDSCEEVAPSINILMNYSKHLGLDNVDKFNNEIIFLDNSNFVRANSGSFSVFIDVGVVGPNYLPGHAHDEISSFELDFNKKRIFVNSGISTYENNEKRFIQRSIKSHNCLNVKGNSFSEVWGGFRVARRAERDFFNIDNNRVTISCSSKTYKSIGVENINRSFEFKGNKILIHDSIPCENQIEVNFHLHPDMLIKKINQKEAIIKFEKIKLLFKSSEPVAIKDGTWNKSFSKVMNNKQIKISFYGRNLVSTIEDISNG